MFVLTGKKAKADTVSEYFQGLEIPSDDERLVVGLSVSWSGYDAYYLSFLGEIPDVSLDNSSIAPPNTQSLTMQQKVDLVKSILLQTTLKKTPSSIIVFDSKVILL